MSLGVLEYNAVKKLILSGLGNGSVGNCQYRYKELTSDPPNPCEKSDVGADL